MNSFSQNNKSFTLEEVEDILKSRKNLVYLFRLSGFIIRILSPTRQNVNIRFFKRRFKR